MGPERTLHDYGVHWRQQECWPSDPKEAAEYLRVPIKSLYNRVQRREISHIKLGRLLRFKKSELDRVLKVMAVMALDNWDPPSGKVS